MAGCIERMDYEILLKNASFKQTSDYISEHADEVYYVGAAFAVFDRRLIGAPPVPVGVGPAYIMVSYVKPCHGSFVLKIRGTKIPRVRSPRINASALVSTRVFSA
jgi:hypothetical protein